MMRCSAAALLAVGAAALALAGCTGSEEPADGPGGVPEPSGVPEPAPPAPPGAPPPAETGPPPAVTETASDAEEARPEGVPDLAAIALREDDLPPSMSVLVGDYVETEGTKAVYRRLFDPGGASIGGQELIGLQTDVALFESAEGSRTALDRLRALLGSDAAAVAYFQELIRTQAGQEPEALTGSALGQADIAEEGLVSTFSFRLAGSPYSGLLVFLRHGALQGTILVIARGEELDLAAFGDLVATFSRRLRTSAEALPEGSRPGDAPPGEGEPAEPVPPATAPELSPAPTPPAPPAEPVA